MKYTLGIDLHKKSSMWVLIDDERNKIWNASVAPHPHNINTMVKKMPVEARLIQVAIEPVSGWRWITKLLKEIGMDVHIAHPEKVQLIAKSKKKTDKEDAVMLAELLRSGYFPEAYRISDELYSVRSMLRERDYLVKLRTSAKNRIHGIATTEGLHLISGGNPLHKKGKEMIMKSDNVPLQELHRLIEDLDMRISPFDNYIAEEVKNRPIAKLLMTIPGVGPITSLMVLAEVGDFSRFSSAERLTSFAGLTPRQRSSGETIRFGRITNAGSRYLRTSVVEAAMRINSDNAPEFYSFLERLTPTCGKKRARVALARKMLAVMWTMVKNNTAYEKRTK